VVLSYLFSYNCASQNRDGRYIALLRDGRKAFLRCFPIVWHRALIVIIIGAIVIKKSRVARWKQKTS
jgi:hypothetical protein